MLYWFQLNHVSSKVNYCTNKSEVKYIPQLTLAKLTQSGRYQSRTQEIPGSIPESIVFADFILLFALLYKSLYCQHCLLCRITENRLVWIQDLRIETLITWGQPWHSLTFTALSHLYSESNPLKSIYIERKWNFSLMFVVFLWCYFSLLLAVNGSLVFRCVHYWLFRDSREKDV